MAYVPGYAADLFISYAHRNNQDGWVTELKSRLAGSLADLSADVDIWFDADRLRTGDTFKQEIRDKLSDTMMMVSILSPAYLQSEFCMAEELDWFRDNFGREIIQLLRCRSRRIRRPVAGRDFRSHARRAGCGVERRALTAGHQQAGMDDPRQTRVGARELQEGLPGGVETGDLRARREDVKKLLHHQKRFACTAQRSGDLPTPPNRILKWLGEAEISVHLVAPDDALARMQLEVAQSAGKPCSPSSHTSRPMKSRRRSRPLWPAFAASVRFTWFTIHRPIPSRFARCPIT